MGALSNPRDYFYDAVGNRLSLTDHLTSEQILYTYDDFNKLLTAGSMNPLHLPLAKGESQRG